jgi:predicted nucleic acid-binding protein
LRYRDVFQHFPGLTLYDADATVMEKMSDLRARYNLRTPDAIHLGTALAQGAGVFVTNDAHLRQVAELEILLLSDFIQN